MWLYEHTKDNKARFVLGEVSEKSRNILVCFGINSSTAKPPNSPDSNPEENLDPTVKRVRRCSKDGFDGWIMLNVYPQRDKNPDKIHNMGKGTPVKALHKKNLLKIKKIFKSYSLSKVWAAWGGSIMKRAFLKDCLSEIVDVVPKSVKWDCKGKTQKGHPRHPLYLKKSQLFERFDINAYLKDLGGVKESV